MIPSGSDFPTATEQWRVRHKVHYKGDRNLMWRLRNCLPIWGMLCARLTWPCLPGDPRCHRAGIIHPHMHTVRKEQNNPFPYQLEGRVSPQYCTNTHSLALLRAAATFRHCLATKQPSRFTSSLGSCSAPKLQWHVSEMNEFVLTRCLITDVTQSRPSRDTERSWFQCHESPLGLWDIRAGLTDRIQDLCKTLSSGAGGGSQRGLTGTFQVALHAACGHVSRWMGLSSRSCVSKCRCLCKNKVTL